MKIKIFGKSYIWHPRVLAKNVGQGLFYLSFCGFYAWAFLTFFLGGWGWIG